MDGLNFPAIKLEDSNGLERNFTENEVYKAVSNMNGDKAQDLDGLTMAVCKVVGGVMKEDIMRVFHHFHGHGTFKKGINAMFISLIPKTPGVIEIKDFRPISLITRIYKILAKVLANEL